jgi:6-pyruvoyltetrahydropterin/6-carboxytetrahydropterin synthase
MSRYELVLESEFSAAHRLRLDGGRLEPMHGHNWRVEVFLDAARLDSAGLVADFVVLQENLTRITQELHDTCLNDLPAFAACNPSTELIAKHICDRFAPMLPAGVQVAKVRVWETRQCAAAYLPRD